VLDGVVVLEDEGAGDAKGAVTALGSFLPQADAAGPLGVFVGPPPRVGKAASDTDKAGFGSSFLLACFGAS